MLWRKFKGNPRGITLLQHLNSSEEGNMSRVYYSEIGDRAKKLNASGSGGAKVTMTIFFLKKTLSSTLPFMKSSHMHNTVTATQKVGNYYFHFKLKETEGNEIK